ncbi:hypothetical protein [Ruegeria sp. HKCCD7255]|uniref:hypothetical protein n=1 Tax=Ruegeria sp. HKCCD7255 TaxID=2683004 RepID=UPI001489B5F0|nr:hypothetical protein [Ruegeria sp. HKCCD7255]
MSDLKQVESKRVSRSPDFRYIPCDAINLAMSDNGLKLVLGVEETDNSTLELVGVHLTHKTAMFLKTALSKALEHHEQQTGQKLEEPDLFPEDGET